MTPTTKNPQSSKEATDTSPEGTAASATPRPVAKAAKKRASSPMSQGHKDALAAGRSEGRTVRQYLEGLEQARPRRGRPRSPEMISKKLTDVSQQLESADPLSRLRLLEEQQRLSEELERAGSSTEADLSQLEDEFVKVARSYSERKGISYPTWRKAGVSAAVLAKAGVERTRS